MLLIVLYSFTAIINIIVLLITTNNQEYNIPSRIIFEPSVLVYEKSVTVLTYEEELPSFFSPVSDYVYSSIKKPITTDKQDIYLLVSLAQAEAGNQGPEGIRRVVDVVLNRVESRKFPNTVEDVIFQPGQFMTVHKLKTSQTHSDKALQIVYSEVYGERADTQSLYFGTFPITHKGLYQLGDHYFSY